MPGGDRTGPTGAGPMTGWGAGLCAGYDRPGYANPVHGRGYGGGCGRGFAGGGRGRRNRYYATGLPGWMRGYGRPADWSTVPPVGARAATSAAGAYPSEVDYLEQQVRALKGELEQIEARINALQQDKDKADRG